MEDVVEVGLFPMFRDVELVCYRSEYFDDLEWSFPFALDLLVVSNLEVLAFEPDLLIRLEWLKIGLDSLGNSMLS